MMQTDDRPLNIWVHQLFSGYNMFNTYTVYLLSTVNVVWDMQGSSLSLGLACWPAESLPDSPSLHQCSFFTSLDTHCTAPHWIVQHQIKDETHVGLYISDFSKQQFHSTFILFTGVKTTYSCQYYPTSDEPVPWGVQCTWMLHSNKSIETFLG